MRNILVAAIIGICFLPSACWAQADKVQWEKVNGGYFSIEKPAGWQIVTAGQCGTFSFIISDPQHPMRRAFYLGTVGPFYVNEMQRQIDYNYMRGNGFPIQWIDMPSVSPLTTSNFFSKFSIIARHPASQSFIGGVPLLDNFQIVSAAPVQTPFAGMNAESIRAVFSEFNSVGEGMFYAVVMPFMPFDGMTASAGTAFAYMCTGITSYANDFKQWEPVLSRCLQSLTFADGYIEQCRKAQNDAWGGIKEINKTWNEISNIIDKVWENQSRVMDACAAKYSAVQRGVERMRDPDTGEVYEVEIGTADRIEANGGRLGNLHLEPVANDDYDSWDKPVRNLP